jgi:SH3-like domain-containing protein
MKPDRAVVFLVLWVCSLIPACAPKPEPATDHATVVAKNASVRTRNSSTSRTLVTLNVGDKVDVLERQENWYRIRRGERVEGWMEESTIVTNATMTRIREMVATSQDQPPQNTAVLRQDANLRLDPHRSASIIRRLDSGTKIEVLDRVTTPRPNSDHGLDAWVKVRPSPTEVGWVLESLVEFDVPAEIAQYTEGYAYTAVKAINQVQDSLAGSISWYVVGERTPGLDPHLDFDGIRVFTWNLKKHRHETAYRVRKLRGVYPLEIGSEKGNPTFRFYQLAPDNTSKTPREFVMYGVIAREVKQ